MTRRQIGLIALATFCAIAIGTACSSTRDPVVRATYTPIPTYTPFSTFTVTRTHTITLTASGTPTFTPTSTPTSTPPEVIVPVILGCWTGGPGCLCTTTYACFTGVSNCGFSDPCPAGRIVVRAVARAYFQSCASAVSFSSNVNGYVMGSVSGWPVDCACNGTCDQVTHDTGYVGGGLPGWVYGGTDYCGLNVTAGTVCLGQIDLTLYCR